MAGVHLSELVAHLDEYLRHDEVKDYAGALNGLQVENSGKVSRVAVAVDASVRTVAECVRRGCDLLVVHHGLFWEGPRAVTGRRYQRLKALLDADVAVYSSHLPLDVHPTVGNNVVLLRALGVEPDGRFGDYQGEPLGFRGRTSMTRSGLETRLKEVLGGTVHVMPFGPDDIRDVGVITGGAGSMIEAAIEAGLDAFVTGEGAHHTHFDAEEGGINVFYGGHYATETWGVRALAEYMEQTLGLPWEFIDHPTGL